jgi:hypothetical protein
VRAMGLQLQILYASNSRDIDAAFSALARERADALFVPIIATAIATTVADPNVFRSGREFAARLGLVPWQNSTGGKTQLGGITKRGNRYLRRLLINGASANPIEGDQSRSMGDPAAPEAAAAGRGCGAGEQDGSHRLRSDAPPEGIPAQGCGGLVATALVLELARV